MVGVKAAADAEVADAEAAVSFGVFASFFFESRNLRERERERGGRRRRTNKEKLTFFPHTKKHHLPARGRGPDGRRGRGRRRGGALGRAGRGDGGARRRGGEFFLVSFFVLIFFARKRGTSFLFSSFSLTRALSLSLSSLPQILTYRPPLTPRKPRPRRSRPSSSR